MTSSRKPLKLDLIAVILLAIAVALLFLKAPGLGDDFQYWYTAWGIHEQGVAGWGLAFHDLRWPVWGLCWVLQGIFGPGLVSFYGVPIFYLSIGAVLIYLIALRLFDTRSAAWAGVVAYLFHPLLNPVIYRPMPDLSEGTLIALAVFGWIVFLEQDRTKMRALLAIGIGLVAAVLYANRITGVFVFGVLGAVALASTWRNPRITTRQAILWLGCIGLVWLACVSIEGLIYKRLTGDFFHSITANLGAKGRKGTDTFNIFTLPFRFFGTIWKATRISPFYTLLAVAGIWPLWRYGGIRGRIVIAWGLTLYLAYNCALQSIAPPRPLLRDAERFLCSLSIPLSLLTVAGLRYLLAEWEKRAPAITHRHLAKLNGIPVFIHRQPLAVGTAAVLLLSLISQRPFFNLGFIPQFRAYLSQVPTGTKIFTHDAMRYVSYLAAPEDAARLVWHTQKQILKYNPKVEALATESEQFWYCRKITWLSVRKDLEKGTVTKQVETGSYFKNPTDQWALNEVINVGGVPEFIFYQKRGPGESPTSQPLQTLLTELPPFPFEWKKEESKEKKGKKRKGNPEITVQIPPHLRGKALQFNVTSTANFVQAVRLQLYFMKGGREVGSIDVRPYFYPTMGFDFQTIQIPHEAETCKVIFFPAPKAKQITLQEVLVIDEKAGDQKTEALKPVRNTDAHTPIKPLAKDEATDQ